MQLYYHVSVTMQQSHRRRWGQLCAAGISYTKHQSSLNEDTHYRHILIHFPHNERTPVQISLKCLHWCYNYKRNAGFGSEWDTLYIVLYLCLN